MMGLDTRYLENRKVRGKIGYAWNNRHAKEHGLKSEWLGNDPVVAAQRAHELNRLYDSARQGPACTYPIGSLGWWLAQVEKTGEHKERPDKVRQEVERSFVRLRKTPLAPAQLESITGQHIKKVVKKLSAATNVSKAHNTAKWLRYALNLAVQDKRLGSNPMAKLRIPKPPPRQVVVWEDEVTALIEHFDKQGRSSLSLAVRFAYDTSQRERDVITFPWVRYQNGSIRLRQAKTGTTVVIPCLPELRTGIDAAWNNEDRGDSTQIIVSETTGQPYKKDNFSHLINDGFRALGLVDEETGQPKVFQDLRRSAVVRLALAGCSIPMISAITGHSYAGCEQILETYLPRTSEMARLAIEKLLQSREA